MPSQSSGGVSRTPRQRSRTLAHRSRPPMSRLLAARGPVAIARDGLPNVADIPRVASDAVATTRETSRNLALLLAARARDGLGDGLGARRAPSEAIPVAIARCPRDWHLYRWEGREPDDDSKNGSESARGVLPE